ncbi:MAG: hypothetical protein QXN15_05450 [Candidatus Jordarchaeales archaeon]
MSRDEELSLDELEDVARAFMAAREGFRVNLLRLMDESLLPESRLKVAVDRLFNVDENEEYATVKLTSVELLSKLAGGGYAVSYEVSGFEDSALKLIVLTCCGKLSPFRLPFIYGLCVMRGPMRSDDPFNGEVRGFVYCDTCKSYVSPERPEEACSHVALLVETALTFAVSDAYKDIRLPVELTAFALEVAPSLLDYREVDVDRAEVLSFDTRYGKAVVCMTCRSHKCVHASEVRQAYSGWR